MISGSPPAPVSTAIQAPSVPLSSQTARVPIHRAMLLRLTGVALIVLLMCGCASTKGTATTSERLAPASAAINRLIHDVLSDRLTTANGIPDFRRVKSPNGERYNVRADLPGLKMRLTPAPLPKIPGVTLSLVSVTEAQARAERTRTQVFFIDIEVMEFNPNAAIVRLGSDYVKPPEPGEIKLCCCKNRYRFSKEGDRWRFGEDVGGRTCG